MTKKIIKFIFLNFRNEINDAWKALGQTVERDYSDVNVAKFDCSVFRPICEGILPHPIEYPSIVWMKRGEIFQHYTGKHDVESLKTYVFEMMKAPEVEEEDDKYDNGLNPWSSDNDGKDKLSEEEPEIDDIKESSENVAERQQYEETNNDEVKPEPSVNEDRAKTVSSESSSDEKFIENGNDKSEPSDTETSDSDDSTEGPPPKLIPLQYVIESKSKFVEFSAENFTENANPNVTFLMMYAPWCEFCSELRNILKKIAAKNAMNSAITIGEIDCMNDQNKDFCFDQKIQGVPTLNLYRNGELLLNDYRGTSLEVLDDCILSHLTNKGIKKWKRREAKRLLSPDSDEDEFVKEVE